MWDQASLCSSSSLLYHVLPEFFAVSEKSEDRCESTLTQQNSENISDGSETNLWNQFLEANLLEKQLLSKLVSHLLLNSPYSDACFFFLNVYTVYIYIYLLCSTNCAENASASQSYRHLLARQRIHSTVFGVSVDIIGKMRNRKACFYSNCLMVCTFSCATPQKKIKKKKSKQHLQPNCSPDVSHSHPFWSILWCLNQPPGLH